MVIITLGEKGGKYYNQIIGFPIRKAFFILKINNKKWKQLKLVNWS